MKISADGSTPRVVLSGGKRSWHARLLSMTCAGGSGPVLYMSDLQVVPQRCVLDEMRCRSDPADGSWHGTDGAHPHAPQYPVALV